jgi:reactive intermediate/imine deaminase
MSSKIIISTEDAPAAIGTYSQAVRVGNTLYLSGQIPLVAESMQVVGGDFAARVAQVLSNIQAVVTAAGATMQQIVKLTVYLTDMNNFPTVNQVMAEFFQAPYPARAVVAVSALPKAVDVEMDAIVVLDE